MVQPSRMRRAVPLVMVTAIVLAGWTWVERPSPSPTPGTVAVPTASGPLQAEPGSGWRLGGPAASVESVYHSFGNIVVNTGDQPVTIIAYRPIRARGLIVVGVELVPDADGAAAGAGLPGYPAVLHSDLIHAQLIGPGRATVPPHGDDHGEAVLGRAQWLVVGYRIHDAGVRRGTLAAIELTYVVGNSSHQRHVTVAEDLTLCYHVTCTPRSGP